MVTAVAEEQPAPGRQPEPAPAAASSRGWTLAIAGVVLGALLLRLWGIRWGLPFAYNLDERSHFVPRAVGFFSKGSLDPDYQLNPAGLIEWVAGALLITHGSSSGVLHAWRDDPGQVWTIARLSSALLSTLAVWLLYVAGRRLFDRWVGLLSAAILATAFLPVHYGHLALNDAPSLAPTILALIGVAGILRGARLRDYALAGAGLGLAVGFKYNAAFVLLPLLTAAGLQALGWAGRPERAWRAAGLGILVAGAVAVVAFALCDPYALLRPGFFRSELQHLSRYTSGNLLLGETQRSGYRYYAWTLPWAFGAVPLVLAVVGAVRMALRERVQAVVLVPSVVLFLLVIGSQGRYFARYAMPVYPLLAIMAAAGGVWLAREAARRAPLLRRGARVAIPVAFLLVCGQGLVMAVHNDLVLARADTRSIAREWMVANIPAGTHIAVEPLVPEEWYADGARLPKPGSQEGYRWVRYTRSKADAALLAKQFRGARRPADFANYGYTLFPGFITFLRDRGVCWIVSGSAQSGRVFNNPKRAPQAIRYYKALAREADLRFRIAPFGGPDADHYFQYDLANDFAPLRYQRPGPTMEIYQLRNCTPAVGAA
jgi:hypothetical protein